MTQRTSGRNGGVNLGDRLDQLDLKLAGMAAAIEGTSAKLTADIEAATAEVKAECERIAGDVAEVKAAQTGLAMVLTPMATGILDVLRNGYRATRKAHKVK